MRRSSLRTLVFITTVALVTASCNRKTIYHHYEHTSVDGWGKDDTLYFTLPPSKQRAVVQRDVELRISGNYPFRGLSLIVEQTTIPAHSKAAISLQPSHYQRTDTISYELVDQEGNIKGQGISLYQYSFHMTDISLNEGDSLRISIHHAMQRETLPGIADIGLRLTAY